MKEQLCRMNDRLRGSNNWISGIKEGNKGNVRHI